MSVAVALRRYRTAAAALAAAAERLHAAIEAEAGEGGEAPRDLALIMEIVAAHYGYRPALLASRSRTARLVTARFVALAFARDFTRYTVETIAATFRRDHALVCYARLRLADLCSIDRAFAAEVAALRATVAASLPVRPRASAPRSESVSIRG